jgi:hypothetical protein
MEAPTKGTVFPEETQTVRLEYAGPAPVRKKGFRETLSGKWAFSVGIPHVFLNQG